jgi:hypothetical protein
MTPVIKNSESGWLICKVRKWLTHQSQMLKTGLSVRRKMSEPR